MAEEKELFVRKSSGLVRTAGTWDVFIYNIGLVSIGIAVAYNQLLIPAFYAGADIALASFMATIGMIFIALTYWFWTITFPRSGGVYVFLSRSLGPGAAFTLTFTETLVLNFYGALAASLVVSVGLSSLFTSVGLISGSATTAKIGTALGSPHGIFIAGSVVLILCGLLLISGMRRFFFVQKIMFVIASLGVVVAIVVIAIKSQSDFVANFNQYAAPLTYDGVIAAAKAAGWNNPGFMWGMTASALVWPLLPLLGGIQSIALGGEIKQVAKGQAIGMSLAIILSGIIFAIFAWLSNSSIGYDFQGAIGYNAFVAPEHSTPSTPFFTLLSSILSGNILITIVISAGFIAWIYFWIPGEMSYTTRTILAWSFDRLTPESFSYVSPARFTPVTAIVITVILSIISLGLIAYTPWGALIFIEALMLSWGACMLAAVFFPYTKKELFEKSPAAKYRVLGVPAMSITGAIATVFMAWVLWMLWWDDVAAGHNPVAVGTILMMYALGLIIYLVTRSYRKSQGIQLDRIFEEIPIE